MSLYFYKTYINSARWAADRNWLTAGIIIGAIGNAVAAFWTEDHHKFQRGLLD